MHITDFKKITICKEGRAAFINLHAMAQSITEPSPTFSKFYPSHHISKTFSSQSNYEQAVSMSRSAVGVSSNTQEGDFNTIVTNLANQDKVPWYQKRNLRTLYFMLIPTCMGIQMTSGFHAQMINAMQILPSWISCMLVYLCPMIYADNTASVDFGNPQGSLKGIIAAAYPLGAILSLPLIPIINDRLGRRWSIFIGSFIMVIASFVQGFANSGILLISKTKLTTIC